MVLLTNYIKFEEFLGNAFIEILERTNQTSISYSKVINFANAVCKTLNLCGKDAFIPLIDSGHQLDCINKNNFFHVDYNKNVTGEFYIANSKDTLNTLKKRYRQSLTSDVQNAYTSSFALSCLGLECVK